MRNVCVVAAAEADPCGDVACVFQQPHDGLGFDGAGHGFKGQEIDARIGEHLQARAMEVDQFAGG